MVTRIIYFFILSFISAELAWSQATVSVDVGAAKSRTSLLALPPFNNFGSNVSGDPIKQAEELYEIISNDLEVTGFFTFIKPDAYLEDVKTVGLRPAGVAANGFDFSKWKTIGAEFLIRGGYRVTGANINLEIYAYNVTKGELVFGKKYEAPLSGRRKLAHTFSNDFVKAVTGKDGFFLHQIVVTVDGGPRTHREIYTMDWDGANQKKITNHRTVAISPDWSPDGKLIAYTAFITRKIGKRGQMKKNPDLHMYEVQSGRRWLVSYRDGMNSGANFLRNSTELLVTLSGKTANIFRMSLDGKSISPLTNGPGTAMNVEPAVSPDGSKIAFSSDRSGKPMIFTMNPDGTGVKQLTFAGHYNSTPTWSPDGKKIAFAGVDRDKSADGRGGAFDIFIINADGTGLKRLTSARKPNGRWANNESPSFAPDGQRVMFVSDRTTNSQLFMVNIDGTNERRITYDNKFYSKPKWGPAL